MSLTKITNRVIEPGTITANSLAEGISLVGGASELPTALQDKPQTLHHQLLLID